jgi:hypothetical protein
VQKPQLGRVSWGLDRLGVAAQQDRERGRNGQVTDSQ